MTAPVQRDTPSAQLTYPSCGRCRRLTGRRVCPPHLRRDVWPGQHRGRTWPCTSRGHSGLRFSWERSGGIRHRHTARGARHDDGGVRAGASRTVPAVRRGTIPRSSSTAFTSIGHSTDRGVAQSLMGAVDDVGRELGGRTLWLGVWERNPRAIAFYTKCGFVDVGTHLCIVGGDEQTDRVMAHSI